MTYKGFDCAQKGYGVELYLWRSCKIFSTLKEMKKYVNKKLKLYIHQINRYGRLTIIDNPTRKEAALCYE